MFYSDAASLIEPVSTARINYIECLELCMQTGGCRTLVWTNGRGANSWCSSTPAGQTTKIFPFGQDSTYAAACLMYTSFLIKPTQTVLDVLQCDYGTYRHAGRSAYIG